MGREIREVPENWQHPTNGLGAYEPMFAHSWTKEEATCFQVYETVTEGTPLSPVFKSLDQVEE